MTLAEIRAAIVAPLETSLERAREVAERLAVVDELIGYYGEDWRPFPYFDLGTELELARMLRGPGAAAARKDGDRC